MTIPKAELTNKYFRNLAGRLMIPSLKWSIEYRWRAFLFTIKYVSPRDLDTKIFLFSYEVIYKEFIETWRSSWDLFRKLLFFVGRQKKPDSNLIKTCKWGQLSWRVAGFLHRNLQNILAQRYFLKLLTLSSAVLYRSIRTPCQFVLCWLQMPQLGRHFIFNLMLNPKGWCTSGSNGMTDSYI